MFKDIRFILLKNALMEIYTTENGTSDCMFSKNGGQSYRDGVRWLHYSFVAYSGIFSIVLYNIIFFA